MPVDLQAFLLLHIMTLLRRRVCDVLGLLASVAADCSKKAGLYGFQWHLTHASTFLNPSNHCMEGQLIDFACFDFPESFAPLQANACES